MTQDTNNPRDIARKIASKGWATPAEIANLAGISRQLAAYWLRGINWRKAKSEALAKIWQTTKLEE